MSALLTYLRAHPWQRRALTLALTVTVAGGALVALAPQAMDWALLWMLGSDEPATRARAIEWGVKLAGDSPRTLRRLNEALWSPNDARFASAAEVLIRLGKFHTPGRDPNLIDRLRLSDFLAAGPTRGGPSTGPASQDQTRRAILDWAIGSGRDNAHVRRLLEAAAADPSPEVRRRGALLAAQLNDTDTMSRLLEDADPEVAGWAAIDAALADMTELEGRLEELLLASPAMQAQSGRAYALMWLDPSRHGEKLVSLGWAARQSGPELRDRLYHVLSLMGRGRDAEDVAALLAAAQESDPWPSAMALAAMARLRHPMLEDPPALLATAQRSVVREMLEAACDDANGLTQGQILTALQAADAMGLPVRAEAEEICRRYWGAPHTLMLVAAARVLGRQADADQGPLYGPDAPGREQCIRTLRLAALYLPPTDSQDANAPPPALTPLPSAAAAVAMWLLKPSSEFHLPPPAGDAGAATQGGPAPGQDPNAPQIPRLDEDSSAYVVDVAASSDHSLPADYIAWHLARSGRPEAFELGLALLPPPPDPRQPAHLQPPRNYSPNSRACGAMLLALAARTDAQRQQARQRIRQRLEGGPIGMPPPFEERGSYQCALLILGEQQHRQDVLNLLLTGAFPARRAVTALLSAGERGALDWLLGDPQASTEEIAFLLIHAGLTEVLEALAPELPTVDLVAGEDLRLWQTRILQDYYAIHRRDIRFAPLP